MSNLIVFTREDGLAFVDGVPTRKVRHSPTGFEWGYRGSGPADLALNILLECGASDAEADAWYQAFKEAVVARIPYVGGTLSKALIRERIRILREGFSRQPAALTVPVAALPMPEP